MSDKATVIFQPSGLRGRIARGRTILQAARELGDNIESLCGGKGVCGKCTVHVAEGHFPKLGVHSSRRHLSAFEPAEGQVISSHEKKSGLRLACRARIKGDVLIYVPEESRTTKQIVSKRPGKLTVDSNPAVVKYHLTLDPAVRRSSLCDLQKISAAMADRYGLSSLTCDLSALQTLPRQLRRRDMEITVSVWQKREILRVVPGGPRDPFGVAVDIGTTTVVASLVNLNSLEIVDSQYTMNPQVRYGEDVVSRVTYAAQHPEGLAQMQSAVIQAMNRMILGLLQSTWPQGVLGEGEPEHLAARMASEELRARYAGDHLCLAPDDVEDIAVVCNTVMHHIFLGITPVHVAKAPFPPAVRQALDIKAARLGLIACPAAYVHILPNESGFVGADNVGVLIAERPYASDDLQLIIDIGTNGELVLGNRRRMLSGSCATGPALEGAQLSSGMRATPGAIERVSIDPQTHEVVYKVIGSDVWSNYATPGELATRGICGSGIIDLFAELFRAGIIRPDGAFGKTQISPRFRTNPESGRPEFVVAWAAETAFGKDICITQQDVRQIQLAKAAIYAGCKLMMQKWGDGAIDIVKIAGGFGLHVDPEKVLRVGMIPDIAPEKIIAVGNAAGTGAIAALVNIDKRTEAGWAAQQIEYVELAREAAFKREFVQAMTLPHKSDPFISR